MTTFAYLIEPPFNFRDREDRVAGCDVQLARHVFEQTGHDFEPIETAFAQLLPGLAEGRWRMTTGVFATEERRKTALFSRPIWALADGLLVARGNPLGLRGYQSVAQARHCRLAVIRDQVQHRAALDAGVPDDRILIFDRYDDAARAVLDGRADAYASVARAHGEFAKQRSGSLEVVTVATHEKMPAFGAFAFGLSDKAFRDTVDEVLAAYLGSPDHRSMMGTFGFTSDEIDMVAP